MRAIWHKNLLTWLVSFCLLTPVLAQNESSWQEEPEINISGFLDIFYVYDFNEPQGTQRQPFLFNHNRHNEFNVNLAMMKLGLNNAKYRANLALHAGTYPNDNYAAEPGLLKTIYEANVGISLNKKNSLWLDAGVFSSHIGFESAISMDNMTLTRSLSAESSPYFLSGAKLTYSINDKWEFAAILTNGWQRIQRVEGNSLLSLGTQVNYHSTDKVTLNWSSFIGTDDPDSTRRMRYFNHFYGQFQLSNKFSLIAGFDIGIQQTSKGASTYDNWYVPIIIGQYSINDAWKFAVRVEYFHDETGVIIPTGTVNGFQTTGFSLNIDYSPVQNLMWRIEGRGFTSQDAVFENQSGMTNNNFFIGTSIAIKFKETRIN